MNLWMIFAIIELILLFVMARYVYKFATIILNIQSAIEESLDILDERYKSISVILQKPVFFDSIEIRQVVSDIYECQKSIYKIAEKLTGFEEGEDVNDQREEEDG
tara:strand:+ start:265 stop:579 length:315 start_codon:yes stop_codon:yes gene_type:complete